MWIQAAISFLGLVILLFLPGYFALRIVWFSKRQAIAGAPATFASMIAIQGIVWKMLGIPWRPLTVLPVYLLILLVAIAVVSRRVDPEEEWTSVHLKPSDGSNSPSSEVVAKPARAPSLTTLIMLPLLGFGAVFALIGPMLVINPMVPLQGWDPVFHANGIAIVEETQQASYFGSLTPLYGLDTTPANYSVAWHAIASLVATPSTVVVTMNAFIAVIALIWVTSMWGLIRSMGMSNKYVLAFLTLAPGMLVFPTYLTSASPPIPNAFAISILPGILALLTITIREGLRDRALKILVPRLLALLALAVGLLFVHPSTITSLALLLVVPGIALLIKVNRMVTTKTRIKLWSLIGLGVAGALAIVAVVPGIRVRLLAQLRYDTTPGFVGNAIKKTFTAWPMVTPGQGPVVSGFVTTIQVILFILLVAGFVQLLRMRRHRWILGIWLVTAALTFTTQARIGPLVPLAGLWYMSPNRTMALQQIPMGVIISIGLVTVLGLFRKLFETQHGRRVATVTALISIQVLISTLGWAPRNLWISKAWGVSQGIHAIVSEPEAQMIYRLRDELPEDALVLGDPANGSAFVKAITGRDVVFPQVYVRESNTKERYLAQHFNEIHTNPKVCELVDELGVTHYYADTNFLNIGRSTRQVMPGLYDVNVNQGFKKIDSGGTATVYEITGCKK